MKHKIIKNLEKLIVIVIAGIVIMGIATNYKVISELENLHKEVLISDKEKEYIQTTLYDENRDAQKLEKEYLEVLGELEKKEPYASLDEEIARVYYFLGYNQYLEKNYEKAEEYLAKAINIFDETKNYFYILNGNNILINIAYETKDYITAVNRASKTYKVLQNPNIEGISKKGQQQLKANILSGLINTTTGIGMDSISKAYYDELVEITQDQFFENDLTLYAKYYYNLVYKNYSKAKENAKKYIELVDKYTENQENRETMVNSAHIYLLRVLAEDGTQEELQDAYLKVKNGYEKLDENLVNGNLKEVEAIYYKREGNYQKAYEKYDEAITFFEKTDKLERIYDMSMQIMNLNSKISVDIDKYIRKIEKSEKNYNREAMVSSLADAITKTSYEKNQEDKYILLAESENKEELIKYSKNINIIYILIIIVLVIMAKKLKKEVVIREAKEAELENMINIDYLTKAKSKQFIFNEVNKWIEKNKKFSLVIFDLDNFKKINDKYGHTFGDEVLVKVVANIQETIEEKGIIGRFGGEEFIILVKKSDDLEKLIVDIRLKLKNIKYSIDEVQVTVSGGGINWSGQKIDELIYKADILLYEAKANGKNKIIIK